MQAYVPEHIREKFTDREILEGKVPFEQGRMLKALSNGASKVEVTQLCPGDYVTVDGEKCRVLRVNSETGEMFCKNLRTEKKFYFKGKD